MLRPAVDGVVLVEDEEGGGGEEFVQCEEVEFIGLKGKYIQLMNCSLANAASRCKTCFTESFTEVLRAGGRQTM